MRGNSGRRIGLLLLMQLLQDGLQTRWAGGLRQLRCCSHGIPCMRRRGVVRLMLGPPRVWGAGVMAARKDAAWEPIRRTLRPGLNCAALAGCAACPA